MQWALLSPLPPHVRDKVIAAAQPRRYARGEVVFNEGDPGEALHLVRVGRLAVRLSTELGDSATLRILKPGDAFGELALLGPSGDHRRTATVTSLEEAETLALPRPAFVSLCGDYPQVERLLLALLVERVDQLSQRLLEALYVDVERRVFRRLAELVDIYSEGTDTPVIIALTQDDLAGLAGATRPTVNQVLQRLASQGVVTLHRGSIAVRDVPALRRRAAQGPLVL
jgi:CRP-like cAMP-binding protein